MITRPIPFQPPHPVSRPLLHPVTVRTIVDLMNGAEDLRMDVYQSTEPATTYLLLQQCASLAKLLSEITSEAGQRVNDQMARIR